MKFCRFCRDHLSQYLEDTLPVSQSEKIAAHLEICAECAQMQREMTILRQTLREMPAVAAPARLRQNVRTALQTEAVLRQNRRENPLFLAWRPQKLAWASSVTLAALLLLILAKPFAPGLVAPSAPNSQPLSPSEAVSPSAKKRQPDAPQSEKLRVESGALETASSAREKPSQAQKQPLRSQKPESNALAARQFGGAPNSPQLAPSALPSPISGGRRLDDLSPETGRSPVASKLKDGIDSPQSLTLAKELTLPAKASVHPESLMAAAPLSSKRSSDSFFRLSLREIPSEITTNRAPAAPRDLASGGFALNDEAKNEGVFGISGAQSARGGAEMPQNGSKLPPSVSESPAAASPVTSSGAAPAAPSAPGLAELPQIGEMLTKPDSRMAKSQAPARGAGSNASSVAAQEDAPRADQITTFAAPSAPPSPRPNDAPSNRLRLNRVPLPDSRHFRLAITSSRPLQSVQIRLELPAALRFGNEDASRSRVVWRGDFAPKTPVQIEFDLFGAGFNQEISVILEQKEADRPSKPLETQTLKISGAPR